MTLRSVVASMTLAAVIGCSPPPRETAPAPEAAAAAESLPEARSVVPEELRGLIDRPFTGDFDALVARRIIRAGVPFNRTFYFVDKGTQRGLSYEYLMMFEEALNRKLKTGLLKTHVILLPLAADALIPALRAGTVDMVVAQLTVTPERRELVEFTVPTRRNVDEVIVTGQVRPLLNRSPIFQDASSSCGGRPATTTVWWRSTTSSRSKVDRR